MWVEQPPDCPVERSSALSFLTNSGEPGQYPETNVALYDSTTRDALEGPDMAVGCAA